MVCAGIQERLVQLEGHLAIVPLAELIEMIIYSSVTGMLELRCTTTTATLYFRDGQPIHAETPELRGMDAVGFMFEQSEGEFQFFAGTETDAESIWVDSLDVVTQGERLAKRWKPLRAHIPSLKWVPALLPHTSNQIQIGHDHWSVLAAVDGLRNVAEIAEHLHIDLYDTCVALATLGQRGLITIGEAPSRPLSDTLGLSGEPTRSNKGSFLDRLIEKTLEEEARKPVSRYAPPEKRYVESD
jgi:hypothetical protein